MAETKDWLNAMTTMAKNGTVREHNRKVEEVCPLNSMVQWNLVKSVFYVAVASAAFYLTRIGIDSNPTTAFGIFMATLVIIFYGFEAKEVEIAGVLTILLNGKNGKGGE